MVIELPGFRRFHQEGVVLNIGDVRTVNAELAIGELAEGITVSAARTAPRSRSCSTARTTTTSSIPRRRGSSGHVPLPQTSAPVNNFLYNSPRNQEDGRRLELAGGLDYAAAHGWREPGPYSGGTMSVRIWLTIVVALLTWATPAAAAERIADWKGETVELAEGDVLSDGVRIHYHTAGRGPLLVLIHGIGGFWFDWRHQIPSLARHFTVVAISQRGVDRSDKPVGVEHYTSARIAGDINAVITHFGQPRATIMAYDSGGFHAWYFAMHYPQRTERLLVIGSYHPATLVREYATNPVQQKVAEYARRFQNDPDAAATMARRLTDESAPVRPGETEALRRMRLEAAKRTSFDAVMNFYKANWPREPYSLDMTAVGGNRSNYPKVTVPTLVVYGREDVPLVIDGLNDLWRYVDQELTLLVVPGAGHGPHAEMPEFVTPRIVDWLAARAHPQLQYPRPR